MDDVQEKYDDNDDIVLFQKNVRDIKKSILIDLCYRNTTVFVAAISNSRSNNKTCFIPCDGTPVTREVYDSVRDGFVLNCSDYYCIGEIPISYCINFENADCEIHVPLPMNVVKRYINEDKKSNFSLWKSSFNKDDYHFMTIQILGD